MSSANHHFRTPMRAHDRHWLANPVVASHHHGRKCLATGVPRHDQQHPGIA
jgi:hypothetical protein